MEDANEAIYAVLPWLRPTSPGTEPADPAASSHPRRSAPDSVGLVEWVSATEAFVAAIHALPPSIYERRDGTGRNRSFEVGVLSPPTSQPPPERAPRVPPLPAELALALSFARVPRRSQADEARLPRLRALRDLVSSYGPAGPSPNESLLELLARCGAP